MLVAKLYSLVMSTIYSIPLFSTCVPFLECFYLFEVTILYTEDVEEADGVVQSVRCVCHAGTAHVQWRRR